MPGVPGRGGRLAAAILAAALPLLAGPAAAKSYTVEPFKLRLRVTQDGTYRVTETIGYRFTQGTFTHARRTIPLDQVDSIEVTGLTSPDTKVRDLRVERSDDSLTVRWRFPERRAPARFRLRYRVEGALRLANGRSVLDWDVLGRDWPVPVGDVRAHFVLPRAVADSRAAIDAPKDATVAQTPEGWRVTTRRTRVPPETRYRVQIRFPKVAAAEADAPSPTKLAIALSPLAAGLGFVAGMFAFRPRTPPLRGIDGETPPDLRPDEAAVLLGGHEQNGFAAALFSLARRGELVLRVREGSGLFASKHVLAHAQADPAERHTPMEAEVLRVFATPERMDRAAKHFRRAREPRRATRERLVERGFLEHRRPWASRGMRVAVAILVAAPIVLLGGLATGILIVGAPLAAALAGLGITGIARRAGRYGRTDAGHRATAETRAYLTQQRRTLHHRARREPAAALEALLNHLPWLALDKKIDRAWLRRFSGRVRRADHARFTFPEWLVFEHGTPSDPTKAVRLVLHWVIPTAAAGTGGAAAGGAAGGGGAGGGGGGAGGGGGGAG